MAGLMHFEQGRSIAITETWTRNTLTVIITRPRPRPRPPQSKQFPPVQTRKYLGEAGVELLNRRG